MSSLALAAPTPPQDAIQALAREHHLAPLMAGVLAARGWEAGPALAAYLDPAPGPEPDPLALVGVREAATRLWAAVDNRERVTVCGDYDVDGITGAALLVGVLRAAGADVGCYLPHRYHDGYGLNARALDAMAADGTRVIVTVDNGITSLAEFAHARELGLDAILTDHHLPGAELPAALAIVNPRLMADPGPFDPLAGVGVAFYLMRGMAVLRPGAIEAAVEAQIDLVALGTIGDLAPLTGENRRLVRAGLEQLSRTPRVGLATLARAVKISLDGADAIAHRLLPRLNAAGRMAHPELALNLLLETDPLAAKARVDELSNLNARRRQLTETTEAAALQMLAAKPPGAVAVLFDPGWHHGVTGIVAARMSERFGRPAILFARDGDGWRGSGRSVPGFDLHAVLERLAAYLGRYGGHAAAVGLTVLDTDFEAFLQALEADVSTARPTPTPAPEAWNVDRVVSLAEVTPAAVEGLTRLEPTGMHNPAVVLAARGLRVVQQGTRGPGGQHLWLELADADALGRKVEAIGFNLGGLAPVGERVDVVFKAVMERWQGKQRLQLRLSAVAPAAVLE